MAGGKLAAEVFCMPCLDDGLVTKTVRVHEGFEDDPYRCEKGHELGMDWRAGPATESLWPPPPEIADLVKR